MKSKTITHLIMAFLLAALCLLTMTFLLAAHTYAKTPTYAKTTPHLNITSTPSKRTKHKNKIKIQTNLYQKELNTRLHTNTSSTPTNTAIIRILQGKIGYIGTYEEIKPIINQINQIAGTQLATLGNIKINQKQNYYTQFLNVPGNPDNSYKSMQKRQIGNTLCYLTLSNTKGDTAKNRSRYWALTKKAVHKAGVHNGDSDKVAVRKIAAWICKHTKYNNPKYDNAESGYLFSKGKGVCRDYSDAFWAMCKVCNIPCEYYTGYANGFHGWNRVRIKKKWYWIDVTWMDVKPINKKYYLKRRLWNNHRNAKLIPKSVLTCGIKNYALTK